VSQNGEGSESGRGPAAPDGYGHDYDYDYDVIVVGSGFGGSVAALRLSEKGYRVAVLEAGRRFTRETLPKNSWALRDYLWAPALGLYGIQRIHLLGNVMILAGAGVGGGSLNYANTLYVPPPAFFEDRQWGGITDWRTELAPYYDQARRMLGVRLNPTMTPADTHLKAAAERMGVGDTFHLAPVGVFFGDGRDATREAEGGAGGEAGGNTGGADRADGAGDGDAGATASPASPAADGPRVAPGEEVPDPYFGGVGPARRACVECGECMTGCRHGAKNMLTENYLHLAERAGAEILPLTTVTAITELPPRPGAGPSTDGPSADGPGAVGPGEGANGGGPAAGAAGYAVTTVPTDARRRGRATRTRRLRARFVVVAAGTYGTQTLLHRMRDTGRLPRLSPRLGELTRTNSEGLVGASTLDGRYRKRHPGAGPVDFTRGVAITSSVHPNADTHIEPVRYGKGSNAMGWLSVFEVPHGSKLPRPLAWLLHNLRHPVVAGLSLNHRRWSERTIIGLVMQSVDNSLTTFRKPRGLGKGLLTARQGHGAPNPDHIPEGAEAARLMAEDIGGFPGGNVGELLGTPLTAHFLGGCPIGADAERGVVDPYHRLYGHPGISVVDGSAVSANLGVNPSLTITAQAERAMALWPNNGDPDPRPAQGDPYRTVAPVEPGSPVVPPGAFGALTLPHRPTLPILPQGECGRHRPNV
jgi:cholesterol oxidase